MAPTRGRLSNGSSQDRCGARSERPRRRHQSLRLEVFCTKAAYGSWRREERGPASLRRVRRLGTVRQSGQRTDHRPGDHGLRRDAATSAGELIQPPSEHLFLYLYF